MGGRRRGWRTGAALVTAGLALLVVTGAGAATGPPAAAAPPASPGPDRTPTPASGQDGAVGRYYVVGQRDFLFQVAARTLGDGNRFREIFDLNRDRTQPDGAVLTDPARLEPGWILLLPDDAQGPQVHTGPVPGVGQSASPGSVPVAATRSGAGLWRQLVDALTTLALALLMVVAWRSLPPPGGLSGGWLTRARAPLPAGGWLARARVPLSAGGWLARARAPLPAARSAGAPATAGGAEPDPARGAVEDAEPAAVGDPPRAGDDSRPEPTREGRVSGLVPEPPDGCDLLDVSLSVGGAYDGPYPGVWLGRDEPGPVGGIPVLLGRRQGRYLWVDLARAPGVFTITGPLDACRRQAVRLARQVGHAGLTVTVVGDALGPYDLDGARRLPTLPGSGGADGGAPVDAGILISGGLRGPDLAVARELAARPGRRVVPVLLGGVIPARWSLAVRASSQRPPDDTGDGGRF